MNHFESFYVPPEKIDKTRIQIKGPEFKHLVKVTRKNRNDIINVIDGRGNMYVTLLSEVYRDYAIGEIQKRIRYSGEPNFRLTLAQAIPKGTRFEWVIEKGTELGVSKFIPIISERSVIRGDTSKTERWSNLAVAAMKQCSRSILPEITVPCQFDDVLNSNAIYDFAVIAHPETTSKSLAEVITRRKKEISHITKIKSGIILIGPEGGFTGPEIERARECKYITYSLGSRRLRSETAGIVSVAIMMELIDNWI